MNIKETLKKMSLQEKISLCEGKDFWQTVTFENHGIPSFFMCDGPSGLRKQDLSGGLDMLGINKSYKSTCFPAAVTTASSWDRKVLYSVGQAMGEEALDQKVAVVLGPGANIKRNPLCGRNFEYFSEDPILAGNMAASFIKGMQSTGVGCSLKHYSCNSQELSRFSSDGIIDERTLREIYLKAFEIAVKEAQPATVMSSYPKINGVHASDNKKLLNDILREEWGFKGLVMTDWGGMNDRIEAFKAGNDLMMPGGSHYMEKAVMEAVNSGKLSEEDVDKCAERIIERALIAAEVLKEEYRADYAKHHEVAVKAAEGGVVLLKNEDGLLPLKEEQKILVVGAMAKEARYQGAGSSRINPMNLENPIDYLGNYDFTQGCDLYGDTTDELLKEIEEKAGKADAVVVFAGLPDRYESEGYDRDNMLMPEGHVKMIETAARANKNTVVLLSCGSAVECDWADEVKAVMYLGLAGEAVGKASYDLLFGKVNPSGKLAESWPYHYSDVISSSYYGKTKDALYKEGIYVGYRYYDKAGVEVRWPFGYGLSYTTFKLEDLKVEGNTVSVKVTNTGERAGSEVVQLYIRADDCELYRPTRELKHFEKISLLAGETREVTFKLNDSDFIVWDNGFKKAAGNYTIEIGNSSRNIVLKKDLVVEGEKVSAAPWQKGSWYETLTGVPSQAEWENMLGRTYEPAKIAKGSFTMENSVEEMKDHSLIMKIMYKAVEKTIAKGCGGKIDYDNPEFKMMMAASAGSPIRSMAISGGMNDGLFQGMVDMANGHFFKGIIRMIKG